MKRTSIALLAVLALGACKDKQDEAKIPLGGATVPADSIHQGMSAAMPASPYQAQLDSGNTAYRAQQYEAARAHYTRATELDSAAAPGWFGVYMAEQKLGNAAAADYAMKKASALNPSLGGQGAQHGQTSDELKEGKS